MITITQRITDPQGQEIRDQRWQREHKGEKGPVEAMEFVMLMLRCGERRLTSVAMPIEGEVEITIEEVGQNTKNIFCWTVDGPLAEMGQCLLMSYYWYDGQCVEPPENYPFGNPDVRTQVMERIAKTLPLRDAVADLLKQVDIAPVQLTGLYDERGCAPMWIAPMLISGITEPEHLRKGITMDLLKLYQACQIVASYGVSFEDAVKFTKC